MSNASPYTPKHRGEPRRCATCGNPETDHPYRHPFRSLAVVHHVADHPQLRRPTR